MNELSPQSRSSQIFQVVLIHTGFHTIWTILYLAALGGVFNLIPLVGWYAAFVLGFLKLSGSSSATIAIILGYGVFAVSGSLSGLIISRWNGRAARSLGIASLSITICLLILISIGSYQLRKKDVYAAVSAAVTTGDQAALDVSLYLKAAHHQTEPPCPLYVPGKPAVIPLLDLQPRLTALSKDFILPNGSNSNYYYCSFPPSVWVALRRLGGQAAFPIVWNEQADVSGGHMVITVNLKNDAYVDVLVDAEALDASLGKMEKIAREDMQDDALSLRRRRANK